MKTAKVFKYIGFGILGVGFMFFFLWLIMMLWNVLVPELFNGPVLSYWQAAGLFILAKILLSGFSPGGNSHHKSKKDWKSKYHHKFGEKRTTTDEAEPVVE